MSNARIGITGELRSLFRGILASAYTRLKLLAVEVHEEKAWVIRQLVLGSAALFFFSFSLLLGILSLVYWLPSDMRYTVFGITAAIFLLVSLAVVLKLVGESKKHGGIFNTSLDTLGKDLAAMRDPHE